MSNTWTNIAKGIGAAVVSVILIALVLLILSPIIYFLGWCIGWFAMVTIGDMLIKGINLVFGTAFAKDILPVLGGVLCWIGSFFRGASTASKNNK